MSFILSIHVNLIVLNNFLCFDSALITVEIENVFPRVIEILFMLLFWYEFENDIVLFDYDLSVYLLYLILL